MPDDEKEPKSEGSEDEGKELGPEAVAEARAAALRWARWATHDFEHFLDPIAAETGLTRMEVLLYIMGERLGELAENGLLMHMVVHQPRPPEDDEEEPWKRGRSSK